ncbi:MAG: ATP-binding cassette domain-containing protein [Verrucomicrobia bacterium]|nr:ATP-binding cassette domain-containing protein [Verrucomicrobiota bacterium]
MPSLPPDPPLALECRGVHHAFGPKRVLGDINLKVARGQFLSLVGPSGCGKSTLLRAIVGTHPPRRGQILLFRQGEPAGGCPVDGPGRDRGIVYQHYSLFPFLTAEQNVAVGLMLDRTTIPYRCFQWGKWRRLRREHCRQAAEVLVRLKLEDARRLYPQEMSGGMRQRVALAQALIMKPEIILLDEPFGALDEATREDLQNMLLELYDENVRARQQGRDPAHTLIIVTHELNEAIYVGDRVVGLSQYWDWRRAGFDQFPGSTIVYDKASPVFKPDSARRFEAFARQREEIRRAVFDPNVLQERDLHVTYWNNPPSPPAHLPPSPAP